MVSQTCIPFYFILFFEKIWCTVDFKSRLHPIFFFSFKISYVNEGECCIFLSGTHKEFLVGPGRLQTVTSTTGDGNGKGMAVSRQVIYTQEGEGCQLLPQKARKLPDHFMLLGQQSWTAILNPWQCFYNASTSYVNLSLTLRYSYRFYAFRIITEYMW